MGTIKIGTYTTDEAPTGLVLKTFRDACINCAGGGLIPISSGATVIFTITSYNPSTKIVTGTFAGTTMDWLSELQRLAMASFLLSLNKVFIF